LTSTPSVNRRRRELRILRLFFSFVTGFFLQYARARLTGRSYDFFADAKHNRRRAIRLRTAALEMGGVLVKVGQFLSTRVDLLPTEYIEELSLLQDEVPGVPFSDVREIVEAELGRPIESIFRRLDPVPLAAASLGQVHAAALVTGESVVVKVQRPRIAEIVEADLASLRYIVRWLDRYTPMRRRANLPQILAEFEVTLRLELDYVQEAHHAERLSYMFRGIPDVRIPRVYWSRTTRRVLCLQRMTGTKVTDFEELERRSISRGAVAEILMRAYLKQILEDGFFHADPHPGNIFVQPGPVVVLVDFGMVGEITPPMMENIRRVFLGVVRRDYDDVIDALARLGFFTRTVDRRQLKRALIWTIDTFYTLSLGELQRIDPREVLIHLQDVLFSESFQIPANYAFLGRAIGTLTGLCTALDPSFEFVSVAEPYARQLVRRGGGLRSSALQVAGEARRLAANAYAIPFLTRAVLDDLQSGELDFHQHVSEMTRAVDRLERATRRLLHAILVAAFVMAGAFVFRAGQPLLAIAALAIAFFFLIVLLVPFRRRR